MNPFTVNGARHYCGSFQPIAGAAAQSFPEFHRKFLARPQRITEGQPLFDDYRSSALRDVERSVFLSASHYRRALDLMIPSSSHWAHVTLYYGAWYAARALLGMFGCVVTERNVVHVERSMPGNQQLRVQKIGKGQGQHPVSLTGSHRQFWELFYQAARSIAPFVGDPRTAAILLPISNDPAWLIERRNKVNYDTERSIAVGVDFSMQFSSHNFPTSLPGDLATQYHVCEGLLSVSYSFASAFGLETDALDGLTAHSKVGSSVANLVYGASAPAWTTAHGNQSVFAIP